MRFPTPRSLAASSRRSWTLPLVLAGLAAACGSAKNHVAGSGGSSGASVASVSSSVTSGTSGTSGGVAVGSTSSSSGGGAGGSGEDGGTDAGSDAADDGGRNLSTDPSLFFGPSRCAQADVLLCEDFESGVLDTQTWTVNGTAPVIDGIHAARGLKALHITKDGNGASYIRESKTFPAPNNTYYGRLFAYFDQLPSDSDAMTYAHWTFAAGSGTGTEGEIRLSGQLSNGLNHFGVGTDSGTYDGGTGDWTNSDEDPNKMPLPVPTGSWVCIEWMHKGDTNETRFYWNAVEHPSLYTSATIHGGNKNPYILPDFTNVWVGWQEYQASTEPFEMWIDEVIIDSSRIGCVL